MVNRDQEQDVMIAAHNAGLMLQSDHMGKDLVIYPSLPGGDPV